MKNIEKQRRNNHIVVENESLPALFVIVQSVKDITKNTIKQRSIKKNLEKTELFCFE